MDETERLREENRRLTVENATLRQFPTDPRECPRCTVMVEPSFPEPLLMRFDCGECGYYLFGMKTMTWGGREVVETCEPRP